MPEFSSDAAAVRAIQGGDAHAFRHFLVAYQGMVERIVRAHVPRAAVPDVAQEAFIRAFRSLDRYDPGRPFGHWMSTLALRACYDHLRQIYARRERTFSEMGPEGQEWLETVVDEASLARYEQERDHGGASEVLDWALERLAPLDRMILTLTALEGHSAAQAAEMLGLSEINVRVRGHRARAKLRDLLEKEMDTP
jgi:RNA polymerase sigma-70 factor, ECF subfamily